MRGNENINKGKTMKEITITTQRELDALPAKFDEYTRIYIKSTERIIVRSAWENSSVEAWENSSVEAWGNSSVEARENSSVVAWGNSSVVAWENSSVVARGNSSVEAWENSSVEAWGNSSVVAWENSSVVARGNSSVVAWGNSSVVAWENSSVVAWENSSVVAWENSSVVAWDTATVHLYWFAVAVVYLFATVYIKSRDAKVKKLYDKATAKLCGDATDKQIEDRHKTAQVIKSQKDLDFETYLERGYVKADGILQKLVSKKKLKSIEVYEVESLGIKKEKSFLIKKGDVFSHGKTIEEAKDSLKYKISTRDTSEFKKWKVTDKKPVEDLIKAYRAITGACEFGTKQFCENQKLKPKYSIKEVITMTAGQYGSQQFAEFFT
jgi:hypothetical protein